MMLPEGVPGESGLLKSSGKHRLLGRWVWVAGIDYAGRLGTDESQRVMPICVLAHLSMLSVDPGLISSWVGLLPMHSMLVGELGRNMAVVIGDGFFSMSVSPSDLRENFQSLIGRGHEDSMADQEANRWGRSGKDPNYYRPKGLPEKY